jgi:hypothetical protein
VTPRPAVAAASALVVLSLLSGCSVLEAASDPTTATPTAGSRALGEGFLGGTDAPTPEATVAPEPGSWDGVVPPPGYRVVLITAGDDAATNVLSAAVATWAKREDVTLDVVTASDSDEVEERIDDTVAAKPDLVVGVGNRLVDVFALLTPQHLGQQFLVVGAELPEPTANVTSVVWPGATFRGSGLGAAGAQDATSFTPVRADDAVTAGVASVLHGLTGIVIALPE